MAEKNDKPRPSVSSRDNNDNDSHIETVIGESVPISNVDARLENPLRGISKSKVMDMAEDFARKNGLEEDVQLFRRAALVAQDQTGFEDIEELPEEEKVSLRRELTHKWDQPRELIFLVVMCSLSAAVQGADQSVINGANEFYPAQFGIDPSEGGTNQWLQGLVAAAPYIGCSLAGCWFTDPLNRFFGRRGAIFITATISALTCFWSAVTNSWPHLFVSRFFIGIGIGAKSATVPVYAAECSPPAIRGALVMQWQIWTAFGIALGTALDLAFLNVPDVPGITGLNWRLMLGSAGVPALFVMAQVYFCPESPRWLMSKGRHEHAFRSLVRIRNTKIQAARDLFYAHTLLIEEEKIAQGRNRFLELFTVARNRRATMASGIVMFMQQFCGINAIAYYSTTIFLQSGFSLQEAFCASLGFGLLNWLAAAPALFTIDTFGRRTLLLTTFPLMAIFLLLTGFGFLIEVREPRIAVVALGIYLHCIVYSPGEGPVPFTYSAEAFPLYLRELGMSWATAICWFFNAVIALTFPRLLGAFGNTGAFCWYAAWNVAGFFLVLFFVPETSKLTLEELDQVFSVPTGKHAAYHSKKFFWWMRKYVLHTKPAPMKPLYAWEANPELKGVADPAEEFRKKELEKKASRGA